jgi:hypothetical protein
MAQRPVWFAAKIAVAESVTLGAVAIVTINATQRQRHIWLVRSRYLSLALLGKLLRAVHLT